MDGLAAESAPAATGSTAEEAEPSASALEEAAAGKTLPNVSPFRGDVAGDAAEGQEIHGDAVHSDERVELEVDDQDAAGGADVVVVVKKRKKSKKDRASGRTEGKKHKTPSPSPKPGEQGRPSVRLQRSRPLKVRGCVCICSFAPVDRTNALARVSLSLSLSLSSLVRVVSQCLSLALRQTVFFLCV